MLLSRSLYCLVLPGDGWVALFEEAIIHGCIPVYVTGGPRDVMPPFADQLKWGSVSLSVERGELPRLPQILTYIDRRQLLNMQRRAARLWPRLAWLDHPVVLAQAAEVMAHNLEKYPWIADEQRKLEGWVTEGRLGDTVFQRNGVRLMRAADARDDAFNTVMQALYERAVALAGPQGHAARTAAAAGSS